MFRARTVTAVTLAAVLVAAGGYAVADARDVVPGPLTTQPSPTPQPPFPTAPGAASLSSSGQVVAAPAADDPAPSAAAVARDVARLVRDDRLGSRVGVQVVDVLSGDVLSASGATSRYTPASTQKLLTAVAALTALDPDATLPTTVVQAGPGGIALVGGGDQLLAEGKGSASAVDGRAGVADLAAQVATKLRLAGRSSVTLTVDDTFFSGPALSPTWDPSYLANGFVAPVSALSIDVARKSGTEYAQRWTDPATHTADVFAAALKKRGVTVTSVARGSAPEKATRLGIVRSATVREIVGYALQHSDNTVTEGLGRLVAASRDLPASFDGATKAVVAVVHGLGVDTSGARLVDCSGLGKGSLLTPRQLAQVLALSTGGDHPDLTGVVALLPISGLRGTLDDRYLFTDARGRVRAKTGSLTGVASLAGTVMTDDGRELVFVVMADRTKDGPWEARAAIDDFVTRLADCGCS
ncbi:D-alanyl-D-alanine carboxypeptidase/D-alanyl-D-alanine endopeptidase [Luteimicrobium subarcticum]|uniref:D-alanyl-D-alanine carboxypeptidase/D-alanyl-D-alanine-endopeptidase (Penicillin-binding protein 4) n=1 Tax=Luteimicrobium subarcticum TaxID=620910 RepID=A0A2M8WSX9_9MICO|nr:D-alanyl-D-alanine carboxypeptidase/D-alanyl-D-alanine-endopeptidase [Luteimicrobium subarcticum]PJI93936.1 D-alanyl-D-alanine carboxypeptidase/D-alanyl-D-alanine-endopeptidase (penicillin-binding protein 4) [Luteimicrobium subarcticum]